MPGRKVTHSDEWWETRAPAHITRCTANLKSGGRCRREAAPGAPVCRNHGASLPVVQQAAARRIGLSLEDAAKALRELAFDEGGDPRVRLKAIQDLLDRGGLGATSKVLVGVGHVDPIETLFRDLLTQPGALVDPTPALPAAPQPDPAQAALDAQQADPDWDTLWGRENGSDGPEDVVDAEVVEDRSADHTVHVGQYKTPKRIRDDLKRLI